MAQISFSQKTKDALHGMQIKKGCCRKTFEKTIAIFESGDCTRIRSALSEAPGFWKCPACSGCFARAVFISTGSVTDPAKRYHAELSFADEEAANIMENILASLGYPPKHSVRKERHILYYKDSGAIEDFLAFIGATGSVFDLMNSKIVKEVRNQTNRAVNCDTANIGKALDFASRCIDVIGEMKKNGLYNKLSSDLKLTADLRLKYDQLSMAELGAKHEPPISKSGVKHRLDKIIAFAENSGAERRKK